jgi:hypothetical protein
MRDLACQGGDLALSGSQLATVTGESYIRQRLATALAEPFDSDPYETGWGSYLDSWLGSPLTSSTPALVASEASRVISILIAAQRLMITTWSLTGSKAQLAAADTIAAVLSVSAQPSAADPSAMAVSAQLVTQAGAQLTVIRTVASQLGLNLS